MSDSAYRIGLAIRTRQIAKRVLEIEGESRTISLMQLENAMVQFSELAAFIKKEGPK